jgi:hypothetical protein
MDQLYKKNYRLLFYGSWLLFSLIQARFSELWDDEAYYWIYSKYLDWGYFDHPPMIAVLIKMGYALLQNELGVRLLPVLLNLFTLLIIEKLITKKDPFLFYTIALSIAVIQVTGCIAVPDSPLIFFTAVFFLFYKRFLEKQSWAHTFLLGFSIALLCYSKYHGVLVVLFSMLPNVKYLRNYRTWIAGIIALLLFAPHLWWQYQHDWISIQYQLFESKVNVYRLSFTTDFILGQLVLPGPIAGIVLLPAAFLCRIKNDTERAMRYCMIGFYLFFLFSSFRGNVEANWTAPVLIPLVVLSHQYLIDKKWWRRILYRLAALTILLVLFARVVLVFDILPNKEIKTRYHAWKQWAPQMNSLTHALPIVFSNSLQRASKYWYYSGQKTLSLNSYYNRRNNFNFWPIEDSLLGKPVYYLDIYDLHRFPDSLQTPIGWVGYRFDPSFVSFTKVEFITERNISINAGDSFSLQCRMQIPTIYRQFIIPQPLLKDTIRVGIFNKKGWQKDITVPLSLMQMAAQKEFGIMLKPLLSPGNYYMYISIKKDFYNPTFNSKRIYLKIK